MCKSLAILGRIIIGILSLLFTIVGFALLIVGILVKTNASVLTDQLKPILEMVKQQASSVPGGTDLSLDNFNIDELVGSLAYVFIGLGAVMLFIGVLGIAGACCQIKCMLIMYMVVVIILLVGFVILVIIIAGDRTILTEKPKQAFKDSFKQDYAGLEGQDTISLIWNVVMNGLQCCGIDGVDDIKTAPKWLTSSEATAGFSNPAACCKSGQFTGPSSDCVRPSADSSNSNIHDPCYEKLWDFVLKGLPFILSASGAIGFMTILAIFSYIILREINNKNKVQPQ